MAHAFKKGDVVALKSGGPPMTIAGLPGEDMDLLEGYFCQWFKGATAQEGHYQEVVLQLFIPPAKK